MRMPSLVLALTFSLTACGMHDAGVALQSAPPEPPPDAQSDEVFEQTPGPEKKQPESAPESSERSATRAGLDEDEDLKSVATEGTIVVSQTPKNQRYRQSERKDESRDSRGIASGKKATQDPTGVRSSTLADMPVGSVRTAEPPPPIPTIEDIVDRSESYVHYGINPMTLTTRDRLSTFSIDVDTASYSISRQKLRSGVLPPTASVRVEEFVNAQDYGYSPPTGDAPFAVYLEAAPNPFLDGHHIMRIGVKGKVIDEDDRYPVHLTFLVDVSGSMSSADKLGLAKQSLHELVENLQPQDTVALATYAGRVARVLDPIFVTSGNARTIHRAIDNLSSGGGTGMSSGVDLAYEMASAGFVKGHENRVIVLSDGDANIGPASHSAILEQIRGYSERGITLSTIGLGMGNYKDVMMEQLANKGDGNYFYIDSMAEAQKVFGEDLSSTLMVIAKDVKIQVEFNPVAVMSYRLIGYENRDIADNDFRNDRVDAGEIGAGHSVTALYDVVLTGQSTAELATVRLRNKTPGADSAAVEWTSRFPSELLHPEFSDARDDFRIAYGAATFAELLRGSPYGAEVTYSELYELVAEAHRSGSQEDTELLELIATAGGLSGERGPVAWR
jgi:Ca-activated chloride channel family protein